MIPIQKKGRLIGGFPTERDLVDLQCTWGLAKKIKKIQEDQAPQNDFEPSACCFVSGHPTLVKHLWHLRHLSENH